MPALEIIASQQSPSKGRSPAKSISKENAQQIRERESAKAELCKRIQKLLRVKPETAATISTAMVRQASQPGKLAELPDEDLRNLVKGLQEKMELDRQQRKRAEQEADTGMKEERGEILASTPVKKEVVKVSIPSPYTSQTHLAMAQSASVISGGKPVPLLPMASPSKKDKHDIWTEIVEFQTQEEQQEKAIEKVHSSQRTQEWTGMLKEQIDYKKEVANKLQKESTEHYLKTMEDIQRWKEAEKRKQLSQKEKIEHQKSIQEMQMAAKKAARKQDEDVRRLEQELMLERIKHQDEEEARRQEARKQEEILRQKKIKQDNDEQQRIIRQARQKEQEEEQRLAKEHAELEERKEKERQKAIEDLSRKIQSKMKFFTDTSKAEMDAKMKEEEERCLRYQTDRERKLEQDEMLKKEGLRRQNEEVKKDLQLMIQARKKAAQDEREHYQQQAEIWKQDTTQFFKEEKAKKDAVRKQRLAEKEILERQIEENVQKKLNVDQSSLELELNKSLLVKIHQAKEKTGTGVAQKIRKRSEEVSKQQEVDLQKKSNSLTGPKSRQKL